jgi:hypothetical protein
MAVHCKSPNHRQQQEVQGQSEAESQSPYLFPMRAKRFSDDLDIVHLL